MDIILQAYMHKWVNVGWSVSFVVALLLLFYQRKEWRTGYKVFFSFVVAVSLIFSFPLFAKFATKLFLPSYLEYERMSWLFFTVPVLAYVFVQLQSRIPEKKKRWGLGITAILILLLVGNFDQTQGVIFPQNVYKVSGDAIQAADMIENDLGGDETVVNVAVQLQESVENSYGNTDMAADEELYYGIRQYASNLVLQGVAIPEWKYNDDVENPEAEDTVTETADGEIIIQGTKPFDIEDYFHNSAQYVICERNDTLEKEVARIGYQKIGDTTDWAVYKNIRHLTVYLVRHGQSQANVDGILGGDPELTEEGIATAESLGKGLSSVEFCKAYSSELIRTKETAAHVLLSNKSWSGEVSARQGLNDIWFGDAEGMKLTDAEAAYGTYSEETYLGNIDDASFVSPVNGESKYNYLQRFGSALGDIIDADDCQDGNVLIVSHSAAVFWLQSTFQDMSYTSLDNASVTVLSYDRGVWTMVDFNDTNYDAMSGAVE